MPGPLTKLLKERAARCGTWCGGESALSFGDTAAEWAALDSGAALIDATWRRTLVATGDDRAIFLHGQTSNHVLSLESGDGCATMALNAQGKPLALLALYNDGDSMLLVSSAAEVGATRAALERFLVADDCEFDVGPDVEALALAGPDAAAVLRKAGIEVADDTAARAGSGWKLSRGAIDQQQVLVLSRGDLRVPWYELYAVDGSGNATDAARVWNALQQAGARPCGLDACEIVRVESGTARFGVDIDESRIAVEGRLEWAIHFAKGCYVGQEVIERAVSRGRITHLLTLLSCTEPIPAGAHARPGAEGDVVTSSVVSPRLGPIALAYLSTHSAKDATSVPPAGSDEAGTTVGFESAGRVFAASVLQWPRPRVLAGRG